MCRIAPVHGNRCVDRVIQDLGELGTMQGLKKYERGLLCIDSNIRVYLKVFLNAVLADTRNYFFAIMHLFSVRDI